MVLRGGAGRSGRRPRGLGSAICRGRGTRRVPLVALAWGCLSLVSACSGAEATPPAQVDPFPGAVSTLDEVGERALVGLTAGDAETLAALRLTEFEHNEVLWPELPASDPAANVQVDWVWGDIETRNRAALGRIGPWFEGRPVEFRGVECRGETQRFQTFRVFRDCWVAFRASGRGEAGARLFQAQLFKDVVERGGGYKIFRYYDEEPVPATG